MKAGRLANQLAHQARNLIANIRLVRKIKERGCWLCRKVPVELSELHFHHLDPKTKRREIARIMSRSMTALVTEIRRCRLLCWECHCQHHQAQKTAQIPQGGAS